MEDRLSEICEFLSGRKGLIMKMKLKLKPIRIITAFLVMFLLNNSTDMKKACAAEGNKNEMDILLVENADIQEVGSLIKKLSSDINITEYEEVNLIHVEYPNTMTSNEIADNEVIEKYIEISGNLPEIVTADPIDLVSASSDSISVENEDSDSTPIVTDEEIFKRLAWHVNEVTGDGKTLELTSGNGVKIAIIDSGVDYNHPYLTGKINLTNAKSYVTGDSSIIDYNTHGTMITGIIAQLAPDAAITPYKVLDASSGESLWTINALIDAVNDGNDIINMSLGTYKYTNKEDEKLIINTYKRALRFARNNNVLVVASAGNYSLDLDSQSEVNNILHLPGGISDVYTVSAVRNKQLASYSNYGSCVDYCAPGGDLLFENGYLDISACMYVLCPTYIDNGLAAIGIPQGYTFSYGTSLSTAVVSAGLADILSYCKDNYEFYKISDVENILEAGAYDLGEKGKDSLYGIGEIDIYNSLQQADDLILGSMEKDSDTTYTYHNDTMSLEYSIISEYGNNYQVEVAVTNTTKETIHNWEIAYNTDDVIEHIWNGKANQAEGYTVVKNNEYNQDIKPGETVVFGYIAVKEGEINIPNEFSFTNYYLITPANYEINYKIDNQWDNGYTASITITNTSDLIIEDWKLDFEFEENIDALWGGSILNYDDNQYTIINDSSNYNILSGESVTFSFTVTNSKGEQEPGYFELLSTVTQF